jgi:hypothetical protein
MKIILFRSCPCTLFILKAVLAGLAFVQLSAQEIKPEWVRTYTFNHGQTNQAIAIAITTNGNVIIGGTSANANTNADYFVISYRPGGDEAWQYRHSAGPMTENIFVNMSLAPNGLVAVTGSTETIALDANGSLKWAAPYGGKAVAADSNFVYVTGFSDADFATVKLESSVGTNVWTRTYDHKGLPNISTAISVDSEENLIVAGTETYLSDRTGLYVNYGLVKYSADGNLLWHASAGSFPSLAFQPLAGLGVDSAGDSFLFINEGLPCYSIWKFDRSGTNQWKSKSTEIGCGRAYAGIVDSNGNSYMTGKSEKAAYAFATGKLNSSGNDLWAAGIPWNNTGDTSGKAIAVDNHENVYVAGFATRSPENSDNDILVAEYDKDGHQLRLFHYDSPQHGNDIPTGIAVDLQGNVFVTGSSTTPEGGTEFLTLKYSAAPKIEKKADGAMHLEFHTAPGQQFAIEASADFLSWLGLTTNVADATGLFQFDDAQATNYPSRFYRGNPVP